jgi:AcrR family transcriptional regulator
MSGLAVAVPTEGRRERKKRELRAKIYDTARQLFLTQGFEATTVEQIAAAADVAPATFFNHFQSKNALLREMTNEVFEHLEVLTSEWLLKPGSTAERIRLFADHAAQEVEASRGLAHDVVQELMRTSSRPDDALPYLALVRGPFTTVMREGQRAGDVRRDLDPAFLAEMVVGALNAAVINWMNDPHYPLEQRLRQAGDFIIEAIHPRSVPPTSSQSHGRPRSSIQAVRKRRGA